MIRKLAGLGLVAALIAAFLVVMPPLSAGADEPPPVFSLKWGTQGGGEGQFGFPQGVAVDSDGNVYVVDTGNDRIQKFTSTGTFVTRWGTRGSGNGQFNYPLGVAVDSDGNVYVADGYNDRIQKFTSTGTFVTSWVTYRPAAVAVDSTGNVYAVEFFDQRIVKTTSTGTFVTAWGTQGAGDGQISYAQGIAVDSAGNVYVADTGNDRIQKFTSNGTFVTKWGTQGSGDGQFRDPYGVAAGSAGNVYVADTGNDRIQKFTSDGTLVTKWGTNGTGDGQFMYPRGAAVDSTGGVYVADTGVHRIQRFGPDTTDPTVDLRTPAVDQAFVVGSAATADFSCDDPGGSGIATCVGTLADGAAIDTSTLGRFEFTVTATDNAGNEAVVTHTYRVVGLPADNGRIVFSSNRDGNEEIYTMNVDGSSPTRLTNSPAMDTTPVWSPDGTRVTFQSDRDGNLEVYAMDADGTNLARLTTDPAYDGGPAWSPDGTAIAFHSERDGDFELYTMNVDGSGVARVTDNAAAVDQHPVWSPDGTRLAFQRSLASDYEIYVINADGTGEVALTDNTALDARPVWSPDGTRLAFYSDRDGDDDIYTMAPDGTGVVPVTANTARDLLAAWSPDGTRLVFTSNRDGTAEIYTMAADGTGTARLTANAVMDWWPAWQPVLDTAGPAVTLTLPADGATYGRGEVVAADYSCTDTPAGVVTCEGTLADGAAIDTTTLGAHTFTVTATDNAGNTTTVTHDYTVAYAAEIRGTVTETGSAAPLEGTWVVALRASDYGLAGGALTDTSGHYVLAVDPGSYYLEFVDPALSHVIEWYDNHPFNELDAADPVAVTAGTPSTVDVDLVDPTGTIAGTVTDRATGNPVVGATVAVLRSGASQPFAAVTTNAAGHFRLPALDPGSYVVVAATPTGTHRYGFHGDTDLVDDATPVTINPGTRADADITLVRISDDPPVAIITGTVTDEVTEQPEPGVLVGALGAADFRLTAATFTDADGHYRLGVSGGGYYLEFFDLDTGHHFEWYDNHPDPAPDALLTAVTAGGVADAAMTPLEGTVAGTVTDETTGDPVSGVWVAVMGYSDGQPVAGTTTDAAGRYRLPTLDIGDYYVVFIDPSGNHALEFHGGTNDPNTATPVTVAGSQTTTTDAALTPTPVT